MKIKTKYHIEVGSEVIECDSLEQAMRRLKHYSDYEVYVIKTELKGEQVVNQYLVT
jgi:hypothetical protein